MKISFIITIILLYSCNEIQRNNSGQWQYTKDPGTENNIQETSPRPLQTGDIKEEKIEVARIEAILKKDFKLVFKGSFLNGNTWGYKIQVPIGVNKKNLLGALEDYEIYGDRIMDKIGNTRNELHYKGELKIKLDAVKYFLLNHDQDQSLFVKPQVTPPVPPKPTPPTGNQEEEDLAFYCKNLPGYYKKKEQESESIEITRIKKDCEKFNFRINNQKHDYNINLSNKFKCNSMGSYNLCTKGEKIDNRLINFNIKEKWLNTGCEQENNITIDVFSGILNSGIVYKCTDATKNFKKRIQYQITNEQ